MSLSDKKLYCGDRAKNIITSTVNLYTDLKDVQNQGKTFNYNGQNLYAKYGDITHVKASKLRCRVNGVEKALLTSANTTWNFKDLKYIIESDGYSNRVGDTSINLQAKYKDNDGNWLGAVSQSCRIDFEFKIPSNAKNVKISMDHNCSQAGCSYTIDLHKDYWRNSVRKLLEVSGNSAIRVTDNIATSGSWEDVNGHPIIKAEWSRGTVSANLGTGWYGLSFEVDSSDLAAYTGSFTVGSFKIEFEEN